MNTPLENDLNCARLFVSVCEALRAEVHDVRWMFGTSTGGDYVARLRVGGTPYEGKGATLTDAVTAWIAEGALRPVTGTVTESDHQAVRAFVDECERGRGKVDRLWWMLGLSGDGQRFIARVQLAKVQHTGEGSTLADAINALGTKLLALGHVARKR